MSFLGKLVLFCLLIGLFQKTVEVLFVALALAWIYGAIARPSETFTLLFLLKGNHNAWKHGAYSAVMKSAAARLKAS